MAVSTPPPPVQVEIGELVLHGFPPSSREALAEAIRSGLAASLAGWHPGGQGSLGDLDAGSIRVARDASPATVGGSVAQAVGRALHSSPGRPR